MTETAPPQAALVPAPPATMPSSTSTSDNDDNNSFRGGVITGGVDNDVTMASPPPPSSTAVGNTNNNNMHKTPPRNNYSNSHTPIASIKRPRSSMEASRQKNNRGGGGTMNDNSSSTNDMTLSPLHPPRAFNRHHTAAASVSACQKIPGVPSMMHDDGDDVLGDQHIPFGGSIVIDNTKEEDELFSPVLKLDHHGKTGGDHHIVVAINDNDTEPSSTAAVTASSNNSSSDNAGAPAAATTAAAVQSKDSLEEDDDDDDHFEHSNATNITFRAAAMKSSSNNLNSSCNESCTSECSLSVAEPDHVDDDDFNPWQFIKSLPGYNQVKHLTPPIALPPKRERQLSAVSNTTTPATASPSSLPYQTDLTVVLDLDETLVHCTVEPTPAVKYDFSFGVVFHGIEYQVYVKLRPYLHKFLEMIQNKYEIIVFTASQRVYADELLNRIDPDGKYFHHRLFRESCLAVEGNFLKDLNVLGRDLSKTVLVDNSPHAFGYQLDNGIPIESWFDQDTDRELLKLERFLRQLAGSGGTNTTGGGSGVDVRELCRTKFQCRQRVESAPDYPTL